MTIRGGALRAPARCPYAQREHPGDRTGGAVRADLRRRSVLAAAVMTVPLVAAGCKGVGALGTPPQPGPDVAVLRGAIGTEQALIARYRSAMAGSPALSGTLGPLLAQHREHLARLTSMLIEPAGHSASPDTTPSAAGTAAAGSGPAATLAALEAAEAERGPVAGQPADPGSPGPGPADGEHRGLRGQPRPAAADAPGGRMTGAAGPATTRSCWPGADRRRAAVRAGRGERGHLRLRSCRCAAGHRGPGPGPAGLDPA